MVWVYTSLPACKTAVSAPDAGIAVLNTAMWVNR
jgi:hypothetical protein